MICPHCKSRNTLKIQPFKYTFECTRCKKVGIDPYGHRTAVGVASSYPPIPKTANTIDVVNEYYPVLKDDGTIERVLVAKIYCPRIQVKDESLFDPNTPEAKAALVIFHKKIENRKRYNRDIQRRRMKEEQDDVPNV